MLCLLLLYVEDLEFLKFLKIRDKLMNRRKKLMGV